MQTNDTLRAVVTYQRGTTARARTITHITIKRDEEIVATATLGGRYSQPQARAEVRRLPGRFSHRLAAAPQQGPARVA